MFKGLKILQILFINIKNSDNNVMVIYSFAKLYYVPVICQVLYKTLNHITEQSSQVHYSHKTDNKIVSKQK